MSISEFYTSTHITELINTICSSYSAEMKDNIKSELFEQLLTDSMVDCKLCDNCKYRKENSKKKYLRTPYRCKHKVKFGREEFEDLLLPQKIYYCSRILKNMAHSSSSPFYNKYNTKVKESKNFSILEFDDEVQYEKRKFGYLDPNKIDTIVELINEKLNQEFEWHQVYYFRMNLLPYPGCNRETYSWTQIAEIHKANGISFSRSAVHKIIKPVIDRVVIIVKESNILNEVEQKQFEKYLSKSKNTISK